MFENLKIRTKLIAILAAPVIALLLLAGLGSVQRRDSASQSQADERLIFTARLDAETAHELNAEMVITSRLGDNGDAGKTALTKQRSATNAMANRFLAQLQDQVNHGFDPGSRALVTTVTQRLTGLGALRKSVDSADKKDTEISAAYAQTVLDVVALQPSLSAMAHNPAVASQLQSLYGLSTYETTAASAMAQLAPAIATATFPSANAAQSFVKTAKDEAVREAVFQANASMSAKKLLDSALNNPAVALADAARDHTVNTGHPSVEAARWDVAVIEKLNRIHEVGTRLSDQLMAQAHSRSASAAQSANLFLVLAGLSIMVASALAWFVGRSISRPLMNLTDAAQQLSQEQLPRLVDALRSPNGEDMTFLTDSVKKIDVEGGGEVGQLAEAFNDIQTVAVKVATEQASLLRKGIGEMFVNLARRNQTLLDRQIEFIDQLEAHEEDPDQLEHLFHLDHLATRMRRNAESLLVLAGAEPSRRRGRPIALSDVVRAALGEVEDFARIDLLHLDEVLVASNAAADVAHLLSEVMENATNFSPPDTRVEVVGHRTKAEGYIISVTDVGIGMSAEQLAEANEVLARPPLVGLAMSRSLGFIVVGRLAARFGISVRLMPSPSGGITAVVALPSVIVHDAPNEIDLSTPDINRDRPADGAEGESGESWSPTMMDSGSDILPPLEFTYSSSDSLPDTYDEAVPNGEAFEEGLAELVGGADDEPFQTGLWSPSSSGSSSSSDDDADGGESSSETTGGYGSLPSLGNMAANDSFRDYGYAEDAPAEPAADSDPMAMPQMPAPTGVDSRSPLFTGPESLPGAMPEPILGGASSNPLLPESLPVMPPPVQATAGPLAQRGGPAPQPPAATEPVRLFGAAPEPAPAPPAATPAPAAEAQGNPFLAPSGDLPPLTGNPFLAEAPVGEVPISEAPLIPMATPTPAPEPVPVATPSFTDGLTQRRPVPIAPTDPDADVAGTPAATGFSPQDRSLTADSTEPTEMFRPAPADPIVAAPPAPVPAAPVAMAAAMAPEPMPAGAITSPTLVSDGPPPGGTRLFGAPPAPVAAPAPAAPVPTFSDQTPPPMPVAAAPMAPAPMAPAPPAPVGGEPGVTTAGLKRRVPRQASNPGERAVPGWDGPERKGVVATKRSPDEVRSMLANYRGGMQKGRTDEGVDATNHTNGNGYNSEDRS